MSRESLSWIIVGPIILVMIGLVLFGSGTSGGGTNPSGESAQGQTDSGAPVAVPAGTGGSDDRQAIEQMLTRIFAEGDPRQCTQDMTTAFVEQSFGGDKDTAAIQNCQEENADNDPAEAVESVGITSLSVDGSSARAVVVPHGGNMDGSTVTFHLVQQGGRWKLDRLADLQIDRAKIDQYYLRKMRDQGATASESQCLVRTWDGAISDDEIERAAMSGRDIDARTVGLNCFSRQTLVRMFEKGVVAGAQSRGIPGPVADCVASRFTGSMSEAELRAVVTAGSLTQEQTARFRGIAESCGIDYRNGVLQESGSA